MSEERTSVGCAASRRAARPHPTRTSERVLVVVAKDRIDRGVMTAVYLERSRRAHSGKRTICSSSRWVVAAWMCALWSRVWYGSKVFNITKGAVDELPNVPAHAFEQHKLDCTALHYRIEPSRQCKAYDTACAGRHGAQRAASGAQQCK